MYEQIELTYSYDGLEPVIDALTVETHYAKHHAAYAKNFNDAAVKAGVSDMDAETLLASLDQVEDPALRKALRNNGGGFYNHNLYFSTLAGPKEAAKAPEGKLLAEIEKTFGSVEALKEKLTALALGQFGSGWAWLSADQDGKLMVSASPNQDNPIIEKTGFVPILAIDVWEHAYYLKYKNLRATYVPALFEIIDWKAVGRNYERVSR